MITPKFTVDQDDEFVKVEIHAPHIRATDVELYIEGDEFKFHLAPYFLRLHLPGRVVEDDRATSSYDVGAGIITCKLPKETRGERFEGLDMLTTLLARRVERPQGPLIEVLEDEETGEGEKEGMDGDAELADAKEFDWQLPQTLPNETLTEDLQGKVKYGFNRGYSGYFLHWKERSVDEVCEIVDPETTNLQGRIEQREAMENSKFDEDYYIADIVNAEDYAHVLQYRTVWWKALRDIQKAKLEGKEEEKGSLGKEEPKKTPTCLILTTADQEVMRQLPRREYLLEDEKALYLGLVDLLFAYSYDQRVNEGEPTVESAWLVCKLSATISGFMEFHTIAQVIRTSARRALAYPLYRNFELVEQVLRDVYVLLKLGRVACLKALLTTKSLLDRHDVYYVYSRIWVDDYCRWIQSTSEAQIKSLASEVHHFPLNKVDVGWNLEALDEVAVEAKAEGGMVEM